ncbi:MAG TPA: hypothetical protein VIV61_11905, partial [Candidatus Ozemobacteraceae bacterium]
AAAGAAEAMVATAAEAILTVPAAVFLSESRFPETGACMGACFFVRSSRSSFCGIMPETCGRRK